MAVIFLSYRRTDAEAWAGLLHQALEERLPGVHIFRDIDNIPVGVKFADYIADAVGSCDVLVAIIGPAWLTASDESGNRRLDDECDFVRVEIATALQRRIPVIPALVGGAAMPTKSVLPPALQDLAEWQNYELPNRLWKASCDRLAASLRPLLKSEPHSGSRPIVNNQRTDPNARNPIYVRNRRFIVSGAVLVMASIVCLAVYSLLTGRAGKSIALSTDPTVVEPIKPVKPKLLGDGNNESATKKPSMKAALRVAAQPDTVVMSPGSFFPVDYQFTETKGVTVQVETEDSQFSLTTGDPIGRGTVGARILGGSFQVDGGQSGTYHNNIYLPPDIASTAIQRGQDAVQLRHVFHCRDENGNEIKIPAVLKIVLR